MFEYRILDNDNPGQAAFAASSAAVTENAGSISIPVRRSNSFAGPLTVNYAAQSGSAAAGQDFSATSGSLTWADREAADKTIVIPILGDALVEGDEMFTVNLTAPATVPPSLGAPSTTTVTIHDAPCQKWQQTWWPGAIPSLPVFNDHTTAVRNFSPLFHFRFSETTGTTLAGMDASGATVVTGTISMRNLWSRSQSTPQGRPTASRPSLLTVIHSPCLHPEFPAREYLNY